MKTNANIIQVIKYEGIHFEIGDIVELVVDSYCLKSVIGKIVEFTGEKLIGNNYRAIACYEKIKIDASEKYNSDIKEFDLSRILRISRIEL